MDSMEDMADDQLLNISLEDEELKLDEDENEQEEYDTRSEVSNTSLDKSKSETRSTPNKPSKSAHQYDYITKLNYLFRDTRFFIIKSNNEENIQLSKARGVWSTLPTNESKLNQAFEECRNVMLIFSVRESGQFTGFARIAAASRRDGSPVPWVLPYGLNARNLSGVFKIDWICRKNLPFGVTTHLLNEWNDMKPVKIGRDGQEVEPKAAEALLRLFPEDDRIEMTPILRKSKAASSSRKEKGSAVRKDRPRSSPPPRRQNNDFRSVLPRTRSRFRMPALNGYPRSDMPRMRTAEEIAYMHGLPPLPFGPPGFFPPAGFDLDLPPIHARYYDVGLPPPQSLMPPRFLAGHETRKYDRTVDEFIARTRSHRSRSRSRSRDRGIGRRRDEERPRERQESPRRDRGRGRESPPPRGRDRRSAERDRDWDRGYRGRQGHERRETHGGRYNRSRSRSRSNDRNRRYRR